MKRRDVTIVVHVDGQLASKKYRLPIWAFEAGKWGALAIGLLVVLFFTFAGPIARDAARAHILDREVARLREENSRVQQLAAAVNRAEANYQALGSGSRYEAGPSIPGHWPLDVQGFVTRGQVGPGDPAESHAGIDIAAPQGTPVRAAGGGTVEAAGMDRDYGLFVLLRHPEGYETMYGHASRLLVAEGDLVQAGQVIALTGSSGRSTAPHLHFEIRREGKSLDPLTMVREGN